jgi:alpha-glucosidase
VPPSHKTHNVEAESKDPNSILQRYKRLLSLRKTNAALREGKYVVLNETDSSVLSYLRIYKGQAVLVALNMSSESQKATFDLSQQHLSGGTIKSLLGDSGASVRGQEVSLEPFGTLVAEVSK